MILQFHLIRRAAQTAAAAPNPDPEGLTTPAQHTVELVQASCLLCFLSHSSECKRGTGTGTLTLLSRVRSDWRFIQLHRPLQLALLCWPFNPFPFSVHSIPAWEAEWDCMGIGAGASERASWRGPKVPSNVCNQPCKATGFVSSSTSRFASPSPSPHPDPILIPSPIPIRLPSRFLCSSLLVRIGLRLAVVFFSASDRHRLLALDCFIVD